jgi:hypothetical protein
VLSANSIVGGRYRVVKLLGGGMKQVYLVEDLLANRPCALAEMLDNFADPDMQGRAAMAFHRVAESEAGACDVPPTEHFGYNLFVTIHEMGQKERATWSNSIPLLRSPA